MAGHGQFLDAKGGVQIGSNAPQETLQLSRLPRCDGYALEPRFEEPSYPVHSYS
jgi:hypothetical protein